MPARARPYMAPSSHRIPEAEPGRSERSDSLIPILLDVDYSTRLPTLTALLDVDQPAVGKPVHPSDRLASSPRSRRSSRVRQHSFCAGGRAPRPDPVAARVESEAKAGDQE